MAACSNGNPLADAITGFFSFLGDPVGTVIGLIAKTILAAAIAVFAGLAKTVPTLDDTTTSHDLSNKTSWIVVYLAVGSLLFAAGKMAIERRGTAGVTALKGIMRVVLVSGAATTICLAAARVADNYSTYLFDDSVQKALDNIGACGDNSNIQSFLLLILAFLLLLAGILHTILMYIRLGVMMIMLGTLPMAAAASMTDWGAGWWRKHIGWMISWLLYKPAVALVLNAGMSMITAGQNSPTGADVNTRIAGIGVMLLSAIALPALLKLVVPAAAAMGTGNPMASMGQAGSQLASGAVQVAAMSGGSGGGGGGQKGPSGASGTGGASGGSGSDGASGGSGSDGASGSGGPSGAGKSGGGAGKAAGGAGKEAAAAMGGPAGMAILAAVAATQVASSTVSGAVEGADGELGNNK
ncbi:hypothetical protein OG226_19155 [Streptomyces sp. NBC_01261]|uniref:hypothetical protein n=1 Tax=unclassified Streptomyces TaxID=2593676 RepID=UPI002E2C6B5F|nr:MULTISPECIES: hypothetical protein [unclassified Streptomyces]